MSSTNFTKYKSSGINWLGEIPEEWEILKVKHLFKISEEASFEENPIILSLTQHGIKKRDISNNEGQIASSYSGYRKISIGDIVLNIMDLLSGFVDRSQYDGVISPAYTTLKPTKKIQTKYFNYFFQKHYFEKIFFPFGQGVSVDHRWTLKDFTLLNFPILKPTIEDQEKIAKFLDYKLEKIDQIIDKNNRLVELLKEKRQAVITYAVTKGLNPKAKMKPSSITWLGKIPDGWKEKKFKYGIKLLTDFTANGSFADLAKNVKYLDSGYSRVIRLTDLRVDFQNNGIYVDENAHNYLSKSKIYGGEILLANVGAYTGLAWKVPAINFIATLGPNMYLIKFNKLLINDFAYNLLISDYFTKQFSLYISSTAQPKLNKDNVKNIFIPLPTSGEQHQIVEYINYETAKIDKVTKKVENQNQKLQEYRQVLISSAVTGKIQV